MVRACQEHLGLTKIEVACLAVHINEALGEMGVAALRIVVVEALRPLVETILRLGEYYGVRWIMPPRKMTWGIQHSSLNIRIRLGLASEKFRE